MRAQKIRKHPIELKQDYPLVYEKEYSAGFRDVGRCALGLAPGNLISNCKNHEFSKFSSEKNARSACFKLPLKVGPFQGGVAMRLGVFLQKVGP